MALGDDARQLGGRLDQENPGHEGLTREMAAQKRFRAFDCVFGRSTDSWVERDQMVDETEFRPVRKKLEAFGKIGH